MKQTAFDQGLDRVEQQVDQISEALLNTDVQLLAQAAVDLQAASVALAKLFQQMPTDARRHLPTQMRIRRIAGLIASRREIMVRYSVAVDRALAELMPTTQPSTYGPPSGIYGRKPYGGTGRQSGEFKAFFA